MYEFVSWLKKRWILPTWKWLCKQHINTTWTWHRNNHVRSLLSLKSFIEIFRDHDLITFLFRATWTFQDWDWMFCQSMNLILFTYLYFVCNFYHFLQIVFQLHHLRSVYNNNGCISKAQVLKKYFNIFVCATNTRILAVCLNSRASQHISCIFMSICM